MTGIIGAANVPAVSSPAHAGNDTVSLGSIGEGEGNLEPSASHDPTDTVCAVSPEGIGEGESEQSRSQASDPTDTVCAVSPVIPATNPIDTERSVSHDPVNNKSNDTDRRGVVRRRVRRDGVGKATMVACAVHDFMRENGLPWFAIRLDQRRLTERLGMNPDRKADRIKVWRGLGYAVKLGMITIVSEGRPNPSQDEKGIIAWLALIAAQPPDDAMPISAEEALANRARVLYRIDRNTTTKAAFEAYCGRVAAHDARNRERQARRGQRIRSRN